MRMTPRRWFLGLGILTVTSILSVLGPAHAYAQTCYTVQVGSDGATVCPWQ